MILTQTIKKPVFIPQGANFVEVNVWSYKETFDEENGIEVKELKSEKRILNLALISEMKKYKMQAHTTRWTKMSHEQWRRSHLGGSFKESGWARNSQSPRQEIAEIEVYEVTAISNEVKLDARWITFDDTPPTELNAPKRAVRKK